MATVVGANVIERDGRVLLVREGKPAVAGQWNLPAGRLEPGETPVETARREAREEIGLAVTPTRLVGVYRDRSPAVDGDVLVFAFGSRADAGSPRVPADDSVAGVEWVDPAALGDRDLREAYVARAVADYHDGRGADVDLVVDLA